MQIHETARFTAMMTKSADLKRRIGDRIGRRGHRGGGCLRGQSARRRQADVLRQRRVGRRQPASRDGDADPVAVRVGAAVDPALALTLDPAMLTACGNDYGYDRVFERPLRGLGAPATCCSASPPPDGPRMWSGRWRRRGRWGSSRSVCSAEPASRP